MKKVLMVGDQVVIDGESGVFTSQKRERWFESPTGYRVLYQIKFTSGKALWISEEDLATFSR